MSAARSISLDRLRCHPVGEAVLVTNDRTLTLTFDEDAGQVELEGHPCGPAGEAALRLAAGLELFFDCADGRLSRIIIEADEPGVTPAIGEPALATIASLLGTQAREAVEQAPSRDRDPLSVTAEPQVMTVMSRLARLDAVRFTSPVADSPLWAVEAVQLARQAGLTTHANAEARRAVRDLERADDASVTTLAAAADAIAELVLQTEPELAARLRDRAAASRRDQRATGHHPRNRPLGKPDVADAERGNKNDAPPGWLDPHLVPPGIFQHALRPDTELTIQAETDRIFVEAKLAPNAGHKDLASCRARLVDPGNREVIASARFESLEDSRVRAEIRERVPPGGSTWVEVVDDISRPVSSSHLHHIRRAMRWAQAALSATRQFSCPADAEWVMLAAHAWGRCAEDWSAARDEDRAYLAAVRQAALCPGVTTPEASSAWAKEVAGRPLFREEPFLAERAGGRASAGPGVVS